MFIKKHLSAANNPVSKTLTIVVITTFLFSTACTTTRIIKPQPDTIFQNELSKGDIVKITTKEGGSFKLKIVKISPEATEGFIEGYKFRGRQYRKNDQKKILFNEIAKIEKTNLSTGKTLSLLFLPTASANYASLNERGLRQQAIVTLVNGRKQTASKLRFAPDSTSWIDPDTQSVITVQTVEVSNIQFVSRGQGAWEGLGLGLLAGALTGALVGLADGDDTETFLQLSAEDKAAIFAFFLGGIGGLVGLIIGAAVGSKDIYRTGHESPQFSTPTQK